ncbi:MAG: restriction endonuclease subunit S [bacterium]
MKNKRVPDGWNLIKLGKLLTEFSERNKNSNNTPVLSVTNKTGFVISEDYFSKKVFSKNLSNYKVIRKGQFAYNPSRVNVGSIACLKEFDKGLLSPMYVVFEAKEELDIKYLDYWISSPHFRNFVKAGTQGTVRDSLNYSSLAGFPFLLPPISEQHKIYGILSSIDTVIEHTQKIINKTQIFKKGRMQELLTCGISGRGHKKFKKTVIGIIPEAWEVVKLGDIAKVQTGIAKNIKIKPENKVDLPYLRVANVQDGYVDLSEIKYISLDKKNVEKYLLRKGDVLFNEGGDNDKLGRGCVWKGQIDPCLHQNHVFVVRCNFRILPYYLAIYAASSKGKEYFFNSSKQTTNLASINSTQIKLFHIPLPCIKEQQKIISIVKNMDRYFDFNKEKLNLLIFLKSALMQVLLTGEVRVKG